MMAAVIELFRKSSLRTFLPKRNQKSLVGFGATVFRLPQPAAKTVKLRIMSFNTEFFGRNYENGLQKIADSIREADADIVGFQEVVDDAGMSKLLKILGSQWSAITNNLTSPMSWKDTAILTKHPLDPSKCQFTDSAVGCCVEPRNGPRGRCVRVYSTHLDYRYFGPYELCSRRLQEWHKLNKSDQEFGSLTGSTRVQQMQRNIQAIESIASEHPDMPVVVLGDFNEPSHLDWVDAAKHLHCNQTYVWPVSKMLEENGFRDAYRIQYTDPGSDSGNTWSPVLKKFVYWENDIKYEPQDRIDFVHFKGSRLRLKAIRTFVRNESGLLQWPDNKLNAWPSDHKSVVADFEFNVA